MSQVLEDLTADENENDDSKPIPLDMIKEATFEKLILFSEKSGFDDRKEITRRRLLENPDTLSYEELYKKRETDDDTITTDESWKIQFFNDLSLDQIVDLANAANYLNMPVL